MNKRTLSLLPSLVGCSTEFSFKNKVSNALSIDNNVKEARRQIGEDISEAFETGGELCVMLLAELTNYYRNQIYYMAVRGAIEMRRYRPRVLEYLQLSVEERAEKLQNILSEKLRIDRNRELKVLIAKYFLNTYPSRLSSFRKLFTKSEYLIVA